MISAFFLNVLILFHSNQSDLRLSLKILCSLWYHLLPEAKMFQSSQTICFPLLHQYYCKVWVLSEKGHCLPFLGHQRNDCFHRRCSHNQCNHCICSNVPHTRIEPKKIFLFA